MRSHNAILLAAVLGLMGYLVWTIGKMHSSPSQADVRTYDELHAAIAAGDVLEVEIGERTAKGTMRDPRRSVFAVDVPEDPELADKLLALVPEGKRMSVEIRHTSIVDRMLGTIGTLAIPIVLLVTFWLFMMRQLQEARRPPRRDRPRAARASEGDAAPATASGPARTEWEHPAAMEWGTHKLEFGSRTLLMGIVNMTPDSFAGDGLRDNVEAAVAQSRRFAEEGADIIDVGGESTRPGSDRIAAEEQIKRTQPAIRAIAQEIDLPISIDTTWANVAEAALDAGAAIINDISALREDAAMAALAAERGVPVVLMHMKGTPATMQREPEYDDVVADIRLFLMRRIEAAVGAGIDRERIIIDPGIGFGKTILHNYEILRRLGAFRSLERPILVGTSRKSMVRLTLGSEGTTDLLAGTAATIAVAVHNGADIVRVHDVAQMQPVARMADAIARGQGAGT